MLNLIDVSAPGPASGFAKHARRGFTGGVELDLIFNRKPTAPSPDGQLLVGSRTVPLRLVRHPRARRYLLRLQPDGTARVTVPRGGSIAGAKCFAEKHTTWLERQFQRLAEHSAGPVEWQIGTAVLFRGEPVLIEAAGPETVRFGSERVKIGGPANLRPAIERHLYRLAARELPPLVMALAAQHGLTVRRVSVRNQKSRWGSCSQRGTISLNWRLIQAPGFVRDYILLHELMHLRQMNHSARYWREVQNVCPEYPVAERWLKQHRGLLREG